MTEPGGVEPKKSVRLTGLKARAVNFSTHWITPLVPCNHENNFVFRQFQVKEYVWTEPWAPFKSWTRHPFDVSDVKRPSHTHRASAATSTSFSVFFAPSSISECVKHHRM